MALNVWDCDYFPGKNTMSKQELLAEVEKLRRTLRLHAGDCCSLNNEVELFRGHWEDAEQRCKELEKEIEVQKRRVILSESQNYCKICGNILDGYIPPREGLE